MTKKFIIIKTTFENENNAKKLAKTLIEKKLSACVQINKIQSFYSWKNKLQESDEFILNIKTKKIHFSQISNLIEKFNNYETAQIISLEIDEMSKKYQDFLNISIK